MIEQGRKFGEENLEDTLPQRLRPRPMPQQRTRPSCRPACPEPLHGLRKDRVARVLLPHDGHLRRQQVQEFHGAAPNVALNAIRHTATDHHRIARCSFAAVLAVHQGGHGGAGHGHDFLQHVE